MHDMLLLSQLTFLCNIVDPCGTVSLYVYIVLQPNMGIFTSIREARVTEALMDLKIVSWSIFLYEQAAVQITK